MNEVVTCGCGKLMDKVPSWLQSVDVQFVCTNCPNRTVKTISEVAQAQLAAKPEVESTEAGFPDEEEDEDED
jgi:hypothetical protein